MTYEALLDSLRRGYDNAADERDSSVLQEWKVAERQSFLEHIRSEGCRTLVEIGAGSGANARFFQDQGLSVTCTDLSPALVERCRSKGLTAHVMDFLNLDFPDNTFDALFAMNCLLHVPRSELQAVLRAIQRPLKPGGLFYWGQYGGPDEEGIRDNDHYVPKRFFTSLTNETIQAEAQQVFQLIDFHIVDLGDDRLVYQSLTLRKLV